MKRRRAADRSLAAGHAERVTALMPQPRSVVPGAGWLAVDGGFDVDWLGHRDAWLDRAVSRFQDDVATRTASGVGRSGAVRLRIDCRGDDDAFLTIDARERYSLVVRDDAVVVTADGPTGVLHALATLRQAITPMAAGLAVPRMSIDDAPRFAWRGVLLDVVRHFVSLPVLRRQIDAMAAVKLNVLHLHLSDDEGFRVESRLYPRLHEGSSPDFYSQAEIRELVAYAADRAIRIVPEIDVPGHSAAIRRAYPQLTTAHRECAERGAAPGSSLDPSNPETFAFLDGLFGELAALFPDRCFHVGGDEIAGADWQASPRVRELMASQGLRTVGELEAWFFARVRGIVAAYGKTVVGWEEVSRSAIPADVLVQVWRSSASIGRVTAKGNRAIVTSGFYLDRLWPAAEHHRVDPHDPCGSGVTREQLERGRAAGLPETMLAEDQVVDPSLQLAAAQRALVVGGEAALWTELVTEEMVDHRLWPAAAVVAERLWSPASVRDPADLHRRLPAVLAGLRRAGLRDDANRRAIAARLAPPGAAAPVDLLLDLVAPVRNQARAGVAAALRNGTLPPARGLDELADAACCDSLVVRRFELDVAGFVQGDRSGAAALAATLSSWRDNREPFARVAKGEPRLERALPIAADIAALAAIGLDALGALGDGRAPAGDWFVAATRLLERQAEAERASQGLVEAATMEQPPAELLIAITPAIRELVAAAARLPR